MQGPFSVSLLKDEISLNVQQPKQKFGSCLTENKICLCYQKILLKTCTEIVVICYAIRTERLGTIRREF